MRRVVAVAAASVLFLAGCGGSNENPTDPSQTPGDPSSAPTEIDNEAALDLVTVEYDEDGVPTISIESEVYVDAGVARLISDGDGAPLSDFNRLALDTLLVDGLSGDELASSYTDDYSPMRIQNDFLVLPPELTAIFEDAHIGARVLWVLPNSQGMGTEVYAFNIGEGWNAVDHATGEAVPPVEGLPPVSVGDDNVPSITVPDTEAPTTLTVQPLIVGDGPELEVGQTVLMQYVLHTWDDGEKRQSSWEGTQPFETEIGVGRLIKAWDEGLIGHTVGSRVLIVAPAEDAYGTDPDRHELANETLVFVVDILDIVG